MKTIRILVLFVLVSMSMSAQETAPSFLLYKYNMNILNPAYAGTMESSELNLGFRRRSLGLQDDPVSQMASFSKYYKKNIGLGLSIINDKNFISKQTDFAVDISYKLKLDMFTNLYFGMKAGGAMHSINFSSLNVVDPLFGENVSKFNPLVGVGAYLKGERYYVNLSSPNLLLSGVQKAKLNDAGNIISESSKEKLHLYFGGGYRFTVNQNLDITPSIFSRVVEGESALIDVSATADISELIEIGATYRTNTSIIGSVLLKLIENTHFGYAYESITTDLGAISKGTHEFVIRFKFN